MPTLNEIQSEGIRLGVHPGTAAQQCCLYRKGNGLKYRRARPSVRANGYDSPSSCPI